MKMLLGSPERSNLQGNASSLQVPTLKSFNGTLLPSNRNISALSDKGRGAAPVQVNRNKRGPFAVKYKAQDNAVEQGKGLLSRVATANDTLSSEVDVKSLLVSCLITGLTFGTAFQVTHNNGLLPVYDVLPFSVGPFLESGLVPLVLAPIWVLYSYLYPLVDRFFDDEAVSRATERTSSLGFVAATWAALTAHFVFSDILYLNGAPHLQIHLALFVGAAAIWYTFDRTKTGLLLGALLAVGAPLSEAFIVNILGWWHYDRPDFLGVPTWAGWCYFIYGIGVGNFARWNILKQKDSA